MTNAAKLLRDFDLADPSERDAMIRGLVDRISLDEAKCLSKACHKQDILGHDRLPLEIRLMIVQHLDISDVYNCAFLVCSKWRNLFLGYGLMIEDVFQKWFPCLYDRDMPAEDMMELYSRTMKRRNIRDMGRFQTRLSYRFATTNGEHPEGRIEGLHQGHTYKDLTCSSSPIRTSDTDASNVARHRYADGRLAWQMSTADPRSLSAIFLQDLHHLHAQQPCVFQVPGQLVQGIRLRLEELGNELVVAAVVGQRKLYAWDHRTQAKDSITLPGTLDKCITQGQSVIIVTVQGDLLLWRFQGGVTQIDASTMPQDQRSYYGPTEPSLVPSPPLTPEDVRNSTQFFHPKDERVFFLTTYHEKDPDWICVYEFRDNTCSRVFTYSFTCPFEMITRESSSWETLGVYDGRMENAHAHLAAKKADSHGTHVLLGLRGRLDGVYRHIYVMFNALNTEFSARMFEPPPGYETAGEPPLLWNEQLYVSASNLSTSLPHTFYPSPVLVLRPSKTEPPLQAERAGTQCGEIKPTKVTPWEQSRDELELREIQEELLTSSVMQQPVTCRTSAVPKKDVARNQDIVRAYPHVAESCSYVEGLHYMCSFYGDECTSAGPHDPKCTRCLSAAPSWGNGNASATEPARGPLNHVGRGGNGVLVGTIYADDDFMTIVPLSGTFYTIFAVDPDRKMAKALI